MNYATPTMQVPKYANQTRTEIMLELKVIKDVGLVGIPKCW